MLRLKSLELNGFKSFADKTKLTFPGGISCVVGPNGCGKSNIADAISWVLGEQSAKSLRGDKMEDVIFAGSKNRKPANFADVTMTWIRLEALSESDEDQLVISRRLYRHGASEYLMNGKNSRLRDIQTALMDFGMGSRAYSIIEQGRIGQILNSKPTERRGIIEEAAGILKYKIRRRESELKLRSAEDNLSRVNDIVNEVQKQRSHLNRQVGKARRYRDLKDALRETEYRILVYDLLRYHQELARLSSAYKDADKREAADNAALAKCDAAITELRQRLIGDEGELRRLEAAHNKFISDITLSEEHIKFNQSVAEERQNQLTGYATERASFDAELEQIKHKKRQQAGELENHQVRLQQRQAELAELRAHEASAHEKLEWVLRDQSQADAAHRALATQVAELRAERQQIEPRSQHLQQQQADLARQLEDLNRDLADLKNSQGQQQHLADQLRSHHEQRLQAAQQAAEQLEELIKLRDHARDQAFLQQRKSQSLKDRIEHLEGILASRRDVPDDIQRILKRCRKPLRLVRDEIDSTHSHDAALERALEGLLDVFLVHSDEDLDALRDAVGKGSVRWLDFRHHRSQSEPSPLNGALAIADLLRGPDPLLAQLRPLLAGVFIATDSALLESQTTAANAERIISADGSREQRHAMTVIHGSTKTLGFLSLKGELKSAGEELLACESIRETVLERMRASEQQLKDAQQTQTDAQAAIHQLDKERLVAREKLDHLQSLQTRIETRVQSDHQQLAQLGQQRDQLKLRTQELDGQIELLQSDWAQSEADQAARTTAVTAARDAHRKLHGDVVRSEEQYQAIQAVIDRITRENAHFKQSESQLMERLKRGEAMREKWQQDRQHALQKVDQLKVTVKNLIAGQAQAEKSLRQQESKLNQLRDESNQLEKNRHVLMLRRDDVRAEQGRYELESARLSSKVAHLEERFLSNRGHAFKPKAVPDEDVLDEATYAQAALQVEELQRKLQALGAVNLLAIEEFEEVEQRYSFLQEQQKDLIDSIAEIRATIHKLNRVSTEKFREAFAAINRDFGSIFTDLFGGGEARLELLDESDLLESGIDMLVQPPGKKLQNAMLMSGGEKALTAIALLLAVFQYRPSPFCLLDEVDAPLDEANVNRFIHKIEELKGQSQFIIITHQKATMTSASSLFGVTMEDSGCSKLVSVKFD